MNLQPIFLMNVALHLPTYREIYHFLLINRKCREAVENLKTTPWFNGSESRKSFLKRFSPETINCQNGYSKICSNYFEAKQLRNPIFVDFEDNSEDQLIQLLKKIVSLQLSSSDLGINFTKFCIVKSMYLENLNRISGDLDLLIQFFKSYTNNGEEMFVRFPEKIVVNSFLEKSMALNEVSVSRIEELVKYVRLTGQNKVICQFDRHGDKKQEELLKRLRRMKVDYIHYGFINNYCELMSECFYCLGGIFPIEDGIGNNDMNKIIEECYSDSVRCGSSGNKMVFKLNELKEWQLPECIKTFYLIGLINGSDPISLELPVTTNYIEKMVLRECRRLIVQNDFPVLKELTISSCGDVVLGNDKKEEGGLRSLQELSVNNCYFCTLFVYSDLLKTIQFCFNNQVQLFGEISGLKKVLLRGLTNCEFPSISFEDKEVFIENCKGIYFSDSDEEPISPLGYQNITVTQCKEMMENVVYLPDIPLDDLKNDIFIMHRFYNSYDEIELKNNILTKKNELDFKTKYTYYSSKFYENTQPNLKMKVVTPEGVSVVPATIRYFEIKAYGFCVMSLGLINSQVYEYKIGHIGWYKGSIGYHSDDGNLYVERGIGEEFGEPYGLKEEETHIAGVGYDIVKKEVFFTRDGVKLPPIKADWDLVTAAVVGRDFSRIDVNYGQNEFAFDLLSELKVNGYL